MTSKLKTDVLETVSGSGTIALTNQLSGMTSASVPVLTTAHMPAGHILQTVKSGSTTVNTTTSASFVATSHSVTITPSSATSKILILHQGMLNAQAAAKWQWATLYRNSTNIITTGSALAMGGLYVQGSTDTHVPFTVNHLDSPNTTSAVTYTIYHKAASGSQVRYNADGWALYITAIEIKG